MSSWDMELSFCLFEMWFLKYSFFHPGFSVLVTHTQSNSIHGISKVEGKSSLLRITVFSITGHNQEFQLRFFRDMKLKLRFIREIELQICLHHRQQREQGA